MNRSLWKQLMVGVVSVVTAIAPATRGAAPGAEELKEQLAMHNEIKKSTDGAKRKAEISLTINAPVDAVWDAITQADKITSWFPLKAEVTPGVGGFMLTSWGEDQAWPSPISIWEPGRHLRTLWCDAKTPEPEQFGVDFFLTKDGEDRTRLRLVHFGFSAEPKWDGMYDGVCRGWDTMLWGLKHFLERHPRESRRMIYLRAVYPGGESAKGWDAFFARGGPLAIPDAAQLKPGSGFTATLNGERSVRGVVRTCLPGLDFQALLPELGDGLLRVQNDPCRSGAGEELSVTLATFGLDEPQRRAITEKWTTALRALPGVSEVKVGSIGVAALTDSGTSATRTVERHMTIRAPVESVWNALTTAEELVRWFPCKARVDGLRPGGTMTWEWDPKTAWTLTIKEVHPPRRIVLEDAWTPAHTGAGPSATPLMLAIDLDSTPDGSTYLHLVHSGFGGDPSWNSRYDGVSGGWTCELAGLKHYLESHKGRDRKLVWINHPAGGDAAAAWAKLSGPDGFALRESAGAISARLPGFGPVSGSQLARIPGKAVVFEARELDGSRIGITFEPDGCGDGRQSAMVWLSLYGKAAPRAEEFERAVKSTLDGLFR